MINKTKINYGILENNETNSDRVVIIIPGISGGVLDEYYDPISLKILKSNIHVARLNIWRDAQDIQNKTIKEIISSFNKTINNLSQMGYKKIGIIGKSFGASVYFLALNKNIDAACLWSPAVSIEAKTNFSEIENKKLQEFASFKDITISKSTIQKIKIPTLIIQGLNDSIVSPITSKELASLIQDSRIIILPNAEHTYTGNDLKTAITQSVNFFINELIKS